VRIWTLRAGDRDPAGRDVLSTLFILATVVGVFVADRPLDLSRVFQLGEPRR
jgi:hypothetical protein